MAGIGQGKPWFRQWLTHKLAIGRQTLPAGTDEQLAAWLGVTVEVLQEAKELRKGLREFGGYAKFDGVQQRVWRTIMPCPIKQAMEEYSKCRDLPLGTLLRSVIQHVLTEPELPCHSNYEGGGGWQLGGVTYRVPRRAAESGKSAHRCDVGASISLGAHEALNSRASLRGTVPTALVRGGLLDLLEGRIPKLEVIPMTAFMHDRAADYYHYWLEEDDEEQRD